MIRYWHDSGSFGCQNRLSYKNSSAVRTLATTALAPRYPLLPPQADQDPDLERRVSQLRDGLRVQRHLEVHYGVHTRSTANDIATLLADGRISRTVAAFLSQVNHQSNTARHRKWARFMWTHRFAVVQQAFAAGAPCIAARVTQYFFTYVLFAISKSAIAKIVNSLTVVCGFIFRCMLALVKRLPLAVPLRVSFVSCLVNAATCVFVQLVRVVDTSCVLFRRSRIQLAGSIRRAQVLAGYAAGLVSARTTGPQQDEVVDITGFSEAEYYSIDQLLIFFNVVLCSSTCF